MSDEFAHGVRASPLTSKADELELAALGNDSTLPSSPLVIHNLHGLLLGHAASGRFYPVTFSILDIGQ